MKGQKKFTIIWEQMKAEVAIFISDNIDFKTKTVPRDKEHYKTIKQSNKGI